MDSPDATTDVGDLVSESGRDWYPGSSFLLCLGRVVEPSCEQPAVLYELQLRKEILQSVSVPLEDF